MRAVIARGERPAVLFGAERSGLENDEVALADSILTVPVNPSFGSLNLAQAVILVAYEFSEYKETAEAVGLSREGTKATKEEILGLVTHMEAALEERGYFRSADRRDTQSRMLKNLIHNADLSPQEAQTWRGIIKTLTWDKRDRTKD